MKNSIEDRIEEKYIRYLNCETDTLELTIEEAIFILETDESFHYVEDLLQEAYKVILSDYKRVLKENEKWQRAYQEEKDKQFDLIKENEELKEQEATARKVNELLVQRYSNSVPVQKIKDIIDRIDYDIKKTKEIISKNINIYASYRKNDYQIIRLRAMNAKSLDIKKRLQKLLESEK